MSRRVSRYSCPSGKARYRNRRRALAGIHTHRDRWTDATPDVPPPDLWPYRCRLCHRWHMTSREQAGIEANTGRVWGTA